MRDVTILEPGGIVLLRKRRVVVEEMLTPAGLVSAGKSLDQIGWDDVVSIRVKQVGYLGPASLWLRFAVATAGGVREFRVPGREAAPVVEALRAIVGDRFRERPSRRFSGFEWILIALSLAAVVLAGLGLTSIGWVGLFVGLLPLVFVAIAAPLSVLDRRRSEYAPEPAPRRRRRRASPGRGPFRSPVLGWGLKVLGLLYIAGILAALSLGGVGTDPSNGYAAAVLPIPGLVALTVGYRLCLKTFEPREHPDPRPPVLFLRAFDDDGRKTFQPTNWLASLHGIFSYRDIFTLRKFGSWIIHPVKLTRILLNAESYTAEELLGLGFRRCGPFVAIGRPGERLTTSGADRMYVPDSGWQQVVSDYLEMSQAVILQPARTEGVLWEIEQVFTRVPRHRILLSMLNFKGRPALYEEFRAWLARTHGIELGVSLPFQDVPSFVYFEADGTVRYQPVCLRSPLAWSFVGNAIDVPRTFHTFIQGLHGRPRDLPRQPKPHALHAALSVPILATLAVAGIVAFTWVVTTLRYPMIVAQDRVRDVATVVGISHVEPTTYKGRAVPYEITLRPEWAPTKLTADAGPTEYLFEFRGGLGKLSIVARGGKQLSDLYSETLPGEVREAEEELTVAQVPGATVRLVESRWAAINGVQWREVSLVQDYGPTASETKRILFYSGPSGWCRLTLILPNYAHYRPAADALLATLRIPESKLDEVLRLAGSGPPVEYRGKAIGYRLSLGPAWRRQDLKAQLDKLGDEGKGLKALPLEVIEHSFQLGEGGFASINIEPGVGEIEFGDLRDYSKLVHQNTLQVLETAMPEFRVRFETLEPRRVIVAGREWVETRAKVIYTRDKFTAQFWQIQRDTNDKGRNLALSGNVQKDHPEIWRAMTDALDSVRIDD